MLWAGIFVILCLGAVAMSMRRRRHKKLLDRILLFALDFKICLTETLSPQLEEELRFEARVRSAQNARVVTLTIFNSGPLSSQEIAKLYRAEFARLLKGKPYRDVRIEIETKEEKTMSNGEVLGIGTAVREAKVPSAAPTFGLRGPDNIQARAPEADAIVAKPAPGTTGPFLRRDRIRTDIPRVLLKVVGNAGGTIGEWAMRNFDPEVHHHLGIAVTNTESAQFAKFSPERAGNNANFRKWLEANDRFNIMPLGEQYGAGADPAFARKLAQQREDEFRQLFAQYDFIELAGGLGKGTGSGIIPWLATLATDMGKPCMAHVVCPFSWEGKGHWTRAQIARRELLSAVPTFIGYNQNIYRVMNGQDLAMSEARRLVNQKLLQPQIMLVRELIQEEGDSNQDLRDLHRRILPYGTVGFIGLAQVTAEDLDGNKRLKEGKIESIIQELTDNPLMGNRKILKKIIANIFWYRGPCFTAKAMQDITNGVNNEIGRDKLQETLPGWIEEIQDDVMFVGMLGVAPFELPAPKEGDESRLESAVLENELDPEGDEARGEAAAERAAEGIVRSIEVRASVIPDEISIMNWCASTILGVTVNGRSTKVHVDPRFAELWKKALRDEATTALDMERLIDFLMRRGCPQRPDNPKMTAALAV